MLANVEDGSEYDGSNSEKFYLQFKNWEIPNLPLLSH